MCSRTRVPRLSCCTSSDPVSSWVEARLLSHRPRSALAPPLSSAVNLIPKSPPRACSTRQATTPSATTMPHLWSNRQTKGAPRAGR